MPALRRNAFCHSKSGRAAAIWLRKARRRALRPRAGPAGWGLAFGARKTPCCTLCEARCRKDRCGRPDLGDPDKPADGARRAQNAALTVIVLARRLGLAAAGRAAIIAARGEPLSSSDACLREFRMRWRGDGEALEREQPCKNSRDYRAGQAPSSWRQLYHAGNGTPGNISSQWRRGEARAIFRDCCRTSTQRGYSDLRNASERRQGFKT